MIDGFSFVARSCLSLVLAKPMLNSLVALQEAAVKLSLETSRSRSIRFPIGFAPPPPRPPQLCPLSISPLGAICAHEAARLTLRTPFEWSERAWRRPLRPCTKEGLSSVWAASARVPLEALEEDDGFLSFAFVLQVSSAEGNTNTKTKVASETTKTFGESFRVEAAGRAFEIGFSGMRGYHAN